MEELYNKLVSLIIGNENLIKELLFKFYYDAEPTDDYILKFNELLKGYEDFFYFQVRREGRKWSNKHRKIIEKLIINKIAF